MIPRRLSLIRRPNNAGRAASSADDGRAVSSGSLTTAVSPWHVLAASLLRATPHSFVFVPIVPAAAREPRGPSACVPRCRPSRRPGKIVSAPLSPLHIHIREQPTPRIPRVDRSPHPQHVHVREQLTPRGSVPSPNNPSSPDPLSTRRSAPFEKQGADSLPRATRWPMARDAGGGAPGLARSRKHDQDHQEGVRSGPKQRCGEHVPRGCRRREGPTAVGHPVVRRRCRPPCALQTTMTPCALQTTTTIRTPMS